MKRTIYRVERFANGSWELYADFYHRDLAESMIETIVNPAYTYRIIEKEGF